MTKLLSGNILYAVIALVAVATSITFVWFQTSQAKIEIVSPIANSTDQKISNLEVQLAQQPKNVVVALSLSELYLQKIRETGDASLYTKIDDALNVVSSSNNDPGILARRAEVENGRHNFKAGLKLISEAIALDTNQAIYYGIKSDAEIELGLYEEARMSLQTMMNKKPNFSSFSRIAYQRELTGDREGAIEALRTAISAGSSYKENIAWAYVEVGKLYFISDIDEARINFEQALALYPNYAPALEGLGRIAYKIGNNEKALDFFTRAFESMPVAQYATTLGDYYSLQAQEEKSQQYYTLAHQAYNNAAGVNVDLEYSLFLADHGDPKEALTRAERAYTDRPSMYGAHTYAWVLLKNNQVSEAKTIIDTSLQMGEYDPIILYHASVIYAANNKLEEAKLYLDEAKAQINFGSLKVNSLLIDTR